MIRRLFRFFNPPVSKRVKPLQVQGVHHDLRTIYDQLNARYFEGTLDLKIQWFGNPDFVPKRHILFGSFHHQKKLIKIHRMLDQKHVPGHFVSYIVYHEMLHHVLPPVRGRRGRLKIHHPAYLQREREFHAYAEAREFRETYRRLLI